MDTQMAIIAEKLEIKMPFARGDRNDHRTCIEFFENIISESKNSFRIKDGNAWKKYNDPIEDWRKAHALIVVLANRASHTGSLVRDEVENLMTISEAAINRFKCNDCGTYVWHANQENKEILQCNCGKIQWKYGR